jgi:hypothetical protein
MATDACMFDILALSEEDLKRVLPKASMRCLAKLVAAYPRAVGKSFVDILDQSLSAPALEFLHEQLDLTRTPSFAEIRQAELELMKIIHEENLGSRALSGPLAAALPQ